MIKHVFLWGFHLFLFFTIIGLCLSLPSPRYPPSYMCVLYIWGCESACTHICFGFMLSYVMCLRCFLHVRTWFLLCTFGCLCDFPVSQSPGPCLHLTLSRPSCHSPAFHTLFLVCDLVKPLDVTPPLSTAKREQQRRWIIQWSAGVLQESQGFLAVHLRCVTVKPSNVQ